MKQCRHKRFITLGAYHSDGFWATTSEGAEHSGYSDVLPKSMQEDYGDAFSVKICLDCGIAINAELEQLNKLANGLDDRVTAGKMIQEILDANPNFRPPRRRKGKSTWYDEPDAVRFSHLSPGEYDQLTGLDTCLEDPEPYELTDHEWDFLNDLHIKHCVGK